MGLSPVDAEDALHEVFLVLQRRLGDFDPALGSLRGWLFGIAGNVVRSERRKRFREPPQIAPEAELSAVQIRSGELHGQGSARATDGGAEVRRFDLRRQLQQAVDELDPEQRAVFVMFELEGTSGARIAEELNVPLGTVHSRLHLAKKKLRLVLEAENPQQKKVAHG